jgi:3-hydroxybutyryl-CoA dehydrogenase
MDETIVVIGGGTMGAGIAVVAAQAGFDVELVEPDESAHARIRAYLSKSAERAKDPEIPDRVRIAAELGSSAGLAIEAVPERLDLKRSVFSRLAAEFPADALLATNTSSLSVSEIAEDVSGPERVIGLHFFNPPPAMKLVEIIYGALTSGVALERAQRYVERFGKVGVIAADTPGFIVNRVARPFYLQAMRALESDASSVERIDAAARAAGFRMGPFELMDLIGLDINLATSESVYERTKAERLAPAAIQRKLVSEGNLGRKTGRGFYDYTNSSAARDSEIDAASVRVVETMVASILDEARMLVQEGAASVENVNLAMRLGVNYPESIRI